MKKSVLVFLGASICLFSNAAVTFTGNDKTIISERPSTSTGLNDIYIIYDADNVTAHYTATTSATVTWYRFSNLGGAYAEPINGVTRNGKTFSYKLPQGDMGYIIEEGTNRYYFWVVDYATHPVSINSLEISPEQECDVTSLNVSATGERIAYYTINGQAKELDRGFSLSYYTLQYDEASQNYQQVDAVETYPYIPSTLRVTAPLCNTDFSLSGDRFLKTWGEEVSVTGPYYTATAVDANVSATQTDREIDNEKKEEVSGLGGSAPVEILFKAVCSDAVVYKEWQMSTDAEFENITLRLNEEETTYTFREQGTTYVRFVASNDAGTCDYYSDTYEVSIGESKLDCPNAFSPGASEGTNDEWKVSYKSIVSFECHIFNRWGIKLAELTHPSQGWDGKHNGKVVPAGVYYYVIKAEGADGKKYELSGDINVINYTYNGSTGTTTE